MEFGLVKYISNEITNKSSIISAISDDLEDLLTSSDYGKDLNSLFIGIICVSPQFESFFKPRKPKYIKDKKIGEGQATGIKYEIEKSLEYDIKIEFESFKNADETEARGILANEILHSLTILDKMKGKIKDFNREKFKNDLKSYLEARY